MLIIGVQIKITYIYMVQSSKFHTEQNAYIYIYMGF